MKYLTVQELKNYKIGFDFSLYSDNQLDSMIDLATELINDYIGYSLSVNEVEDEEGQAIIQHDGRLYIDLKGKNISSVNKVEIFYDLSNSITIDLTNIELHKKPGFLYLLNNSLYGRQIYRNFIGPISYKVSYSMEVNSIPEKVKYATAKIVGNLFRADLNAESGAIGEDGKVKSFTSGDYSVKFEGSSINYKGVGNAGAPENKFLDDSVKILLYKLRRTGQNTY